MQGFIIGMSVCASAASPVGLALSVRLLAPGCLLLALLRSQVTSLSFPSSVSFRWPRLPLCLCVLAAPARTAAFLLSSAACGGLRVLAGSPGSGRLPASALNPVTSCKDVCSQSRIDQHVSVTTEKKHDNYMCVLCGVEPWYPQASLAGVCWSS